jgi:hypothetical protein
LSDFSWIQALSSVMALLGIEPVRQATKSVKLKLPALALE